MASGKKRAASTLAAAVLTLCGGLLAVSAFDGEPAPARAAEVSAPPVTRAPSQPVFAEITKPLGKSVPTRLSIPAIGLKNAPIGSVGLNADQTVEVPPLSRPNLVGWYKHRPTPGEKGPAVLLGHVDGYGKPAVFHQAHKLRSGDKITVNRKDGSVATFAVTSLERVDKDAFPTEKVYGKTDAAELRLVTCGGKFDPSTGHYEDNIIVYAHLSS